MINLSSKSLNHVLSIAVFTSLMLSGTTLTSIAMDDEKMKNNDSNIVIKEEVIKEITQTGIVRNLFEGCISGYEGLSELTLNISEKNNYETLRDEANERGRKYGDDIMNQHFLFMCRKSGDLPTNLVNEFKLEIDLKKEILKIINEIIKVIEKKVNHEKKPINFENNILENKSKFTFKDIYNIENGIFQSFDINYSSLNHLNDKEELFKELNFALDKLNFEKEILPLDIKKKENAELSRSILKIQNEFEELNSTKKSFKKDGIHFSNEAEIKRNELEKFLDKFQSNFKNKLNEEKKESKEFYGFKKLYIDYNKEKNLKKNNIKKLTVKIPSFKDLNKPEKIKTPPSR